jgi:hypothetical protein
MSIDDATPAEWDRVAGKGHSAAFLSYKNMAEKEAREINSAVEEPPHYNKGDVECIDAIRASMDRTSYSGYLKGNTLKYLWRYTYKKKPLEDLRKAKWYLDKLIEEQE